MSTMVRLWRPDTSYGSDPENGPGAVRVIKHWTEKGGVVVSRETRLYARPVYSHIEMRENVIEGIRRLFDQGLDVEWGDKITIEQGPPP